MEYFILNFLNATGIYPGTEDIIDKCMTDSIDDLIVLVAAI
jgi:hypothetical protein